MHIVHLCTEIAPIAKVGGLADVVYGLSIELIKQGHTVEVILPKYDTIDYSRLKNLQVHYRELWSFDGPSSYNNTIWSAEIDQIKILFIEPHHPSYFFSRGAIYGCADDVDRFLYFTRTAMEFLFKSKRQPDCIHLHDWPVAIASTLHKDMYIPLGFQAGGLLLTIHNMEHQGRCSPHNLTRIGLTGDYYLTADRYQDPDIPQVINLLKGGINTADVITTVSPTYKQEILRRPNGHGLEEVLVANQQKIHGILNGIDPDFWNPEKDPHLIEKFPPIRSIAQKNLPQLLKAKEENKKQLCTHLGLDAARGPLIGCVTRLVPQKGPALIASAIKHAMQKGALFVLLGSEYSIETKKVFEELKKEFSSTRQFGLLLDRNESIAHLIFAGSDFITVPSIFEPCGLTQLISLRYGTLPIVRQTGGLADTVFDVDGHCEEDAKNGIVFKESGKADMDRAIDRAVKLWGEEKDLFKKLVVNALRCDYSWRVSGQKYIKLYNTLSNKS